MSVLLKVTQWGFFKSTNTKKADLKSQPSGFVIGGR